MSEHREDVVIFRTGLLHEADLVAGALEGQGIPYYRRMEALGGPEFAMPYAPSNGPGTSWAVHVPRQAVAEAREVIRALPVTHQVAPGPWAFRPTAGAKVLWRVYAIIVLVGLAVAYSSNVVAVVRALFK